MDHYSSLDQLRTSELTVLRRGFFKPYFELTDGQFYYGKLSYIGSWKRVPLIETTQGTWTIQRKSLMSATYLIQQPQEYTIGQVTPQLWGRKTDLVMNNGFTAAFVSKGMFKTTFTFTNYEYGDMVIIKPALWSFGKPFNITIDLNLLKSVPALPFFTLLGVNLILLKQAQAAAAGAGVH